MRTTEVIRKTMSFRDAFGNDLADNTNLNTKRDCLERLKSHRRWLEDASQETLQDIDDFIRKLGIEYEDI